jgi:hypothetical protein
MSDVKNLILTMLDINGIEVNVTVPATTIIKVKHEDGQVEDLRLTKKARVNLPIESMTEQELKNEIRNASSVNYKATKALEAGKKVDPATIENSKKRMEAAKALFEQKFPKSGRTTKLSKAEAIIEAIRNSALPEDQKAAALAKLEDLVSVLKGSVKKDKPAAEVAKDQEVAKKEATQEAPTETPAPTETATTGRRR